MLGPQLTVKQCTKNYKKTSPKKHLFCFLGGMGFEGQSSSSKSPDSTCDRRAPLRRKVCKGQTLITQTERGRNPYSIPCSPHIPSGSIRSASAPQSWGVFFPSGAGGAEGVLRVLGDLGVVVGSEEAWVHGDVGHGQLGGGCG